MVLMDEHDVMDRLALLRNGRRMPILCSLDRSLGKRILSESLEDQAKGLRSDYFDISKEMEPSENYLTSVASSQGVLAIGSALEQGFLYFVKDNSAVKDVPDIQRFKSVHKEQLGAPIQSLDWSGSHLAIGTKSGITKIFRAQVRDDIMEQFVPVGQYIDSPIQQMIAPSFAVNSHVKSVEFTSDYNFEFVDSNKGSSINENPSVPSRFLSLTWNQVSVWDALQESAPISRMLPSDAPLNCASWSFHDPLIVSGGQDKGLFITDARIGETVWRSKNAHDRALRDAKFNPFIPYWVASAGEDDIVNIWDIRATYHMPVAKIDGHSSIVTSVAWSNIRPENISTSSMDGTMKFWTLTSQDFPVWDTHYKVSNFSSEDTFPIVQDKNVVIQQSQSKASRLQSWLSDENTQKEKKKTVLLAGAMGLGTWGKKQAGSYYKGELNFESRGSVVRVTASKTRPSLYYCITSGGQLTSQIVRFDTKTNLKARHKFDPENKDPLCIDIEDAIYCRHIKEAKIKLELYKQNTADRDNYEVVRELEKCLELNPPIESNEWDFDSLAKDWEATINHFKNDLKYWSYRIPPGFCEHYKFPLEIDGPIIASSLIEEEENPTPIPSTPITENTDSYSDDHDIYFDYNRRLSDENSVGFDDQSSCLQAPSSLNDQPYIESESSSISIKNRRNMQHIPPIVTINDKDVAVPNNNPFTPPYSASISAGATNSQPTVIDNNNKNPFEQPQTDIPTPKHMHHFENTQATNPFETKSLEVPNSSNDDDNDDKKSISSIESSRSSKSSRSKRRSWLSLSLTRSKQAVDDDQKVPSSAKSSRSRLHFF